jgi:hypothetical protein
VDKVGIGIDIRKRKSTHTGYSQAQSDPTQRTDKLKKHWEEIEPFLGWIQEGFTLEDSDNEHTPNEPPDVYEYLSSARARTKVRKWRRGKVKQNMDSPLDNCSLMYHPTYLPIFSRGSSHGESGS